MDSTIQALVSFVTSSKVYPTIRTIDGCSTSPMIRINSQEVILACSPNYLGLSGDPRVGQAAKDAIDKYGVGTNGSGIVSGYIDIYAELERTLADYMGEEDCVVFNSVSQANMGLITSLIDPPLLSLLPSGTTSAGDRTVFMDKENHASLFDAVKLCHKEKMTVYGHRNVRHLETLLERSSSERRFVISDGYFSMSATLSPLPELSEIANRYNATLIIDDAHGFGVLGDDGCGIFSDYKINIADNQYLVGSLSKAIGVRGGFICGDTNFIKYLRVSSRSYLFSGTEPAPVAAAALEGLRISIAEPWRRQLVLANAKYLRQALTSLGCVILGDHHIVPWFIGDDNDAEWAAKKLLEMGVFAQAIRYPAVSRTHALVRFIPMATHETSHLDRIAEACEKVKKEMSCR